LTIPKVIVPFQIERGAIGIEVPAIEGLQRVYPQVGMNGRIRFAVSQEVLSNARIITISGEFDSAAADEARPVLMAAAADPDRVLVIDLTGCRFLDSIAIALIVGAARPLINGQIKIAIAAARGSEVIEVLRLTGIDRTIPILPNVELALASALEIE
jgi:anti-anti-sigma factor